MNGEMFQIASIVAASKKAMQSNEPIAYFPATYENHIKFAFLPQMGFWGMKQYTAPNVSAWFEQIRKNQVTDVKLLCPCSVEVFWDFQIRHKVLFYVFTETGR